jgi:hypothetical protein
VNTPAIVSATFFAQYQAMGNRFRNDSSVDTWGLVMMVAFVAAAVTGSFILYRCYKWREAWKRESPVALFNEACDAHKIGNHHKRRLLKIAESNGLAHPVLLFLSPGVWESLGSRKCPRRTRGRSPASQSKGHFVARPNKRSEA